MKKKFSKNLRKERHEKTHPTTLVIDPKSRRLFAFIMLLIPIVAFLILEFGLRVSGYGINTDLFIPASGDYSKYYKVNPNVARRFFVKQKNVPTPPNDLFLMNKPENGFRIFVMGGSTAAGYPYGNNLMFSRILNQRLSDAFPEKHIEVINTAMAAINSFALLDFMDEILEKKPDAILIYAGHNEFYGALGVGSTETLGRFRPLIKIYLKLKRLKTVQLLRSAIWQMRNAISSISRKENAINPSATLMERLVAEQTIPYQSALYEAGKKQYRENLRDILKKAKQAKVPVLVSELVSNIRDQQPFVSVAAKDFPPADQVHQEAKSLEEQGRFEEAKLKYYLAKDLDALRFRAPEEFNNIIHQVAQEFDAVLVPMKFYFESASPQGIMGNNLFLEHLHPNIDGYFRMADAFFETMRQHRMIAPYWLDYQILPASYYRQNWGLTALDSLYGNLRIKILQAGWPFKPKSAPSHEMLDYMPTSKAESLAVKVWTNADYSLERAHVDLAMSYETAGTYDLAYAEYRALICLTPLNLSPYLKTAEMLIKGANFRSALILLRKSLTLGETFFANKWIGQLLVNFNEIDQALHYLEKAYRENSSDPQLIYSLSGVYALKAKYQESRKLLDQLYKIAPDFKDPYNLKEQLDRVMKK